MPFRPSTWQWHSKLSRAADLVGAAVAISCIALTLGLAVTYVPGPAFYNVTDVVKREAVSGTVLYAVLPNPKLLHALRRYTLVVRLDDGRVISAASYSHRIPDRGSRVTLTRIDHATGTSAYNVVDNAPSE